MQKPSSDLPESELLVIYFVAGLSQSCLPVSTTRQAVNCCASVLLGKPLDTNIISERTYRTLNSSIQQVLERGDIGKQLSADIDISVPKKLCNAAQKALELMSTPEVGLDALLSHFSPDMSELFKFIFSGALAAMESETEGWRMSTRFIARADAFYTRQREITSGKPHSEPLAHEILREGRYPLSTFWDFVVLNKNKIEDKEKGKKEKELLSRDEYRKNIDRVRSGQNLMTPASISKLLQLQHIQFGTFKGKYLRVRADISLMMTAALFQGERTPPPKGYTVLYREYFAVAREELIDYQVQTVSNARIEAQHRKEFPNKKLPVYVLEVDPQD